MHNARCSLGPQQGSDGKGNTELLEDELWPH